MRKNKVDVITMGCAKNLVDSETLMRLFEQSGYTVEHDPVKADGEIVVVNTCGFIESAREESVNMILETVQAKSRGEVGKVFVMGCLSERYMDELKQEIPEVDGFYGKFDWKNLIADLGKAYHTVPADLRTLTTPAHYAFVKIAEGCNRGCAYCSIPIMTGRYKSRPEAEIIEEVRGLAAKGVKELQLIAQDLTYYGIDTDEKAALPALVRALCKIDGIEWIRLHYAYPTHFPLELIEVIREEPKVCKYLDIALQHSSDRMLEKMRRHITKSEQTDLLRKLREGVPGLAIRTTLMVGHPGETDEDFEDLMDFVEEQRFDRMGAFMYSHEEGTYDFLHYEDDIPREVKQERLDRLMQLQETIALERSSAFVGSTERVIIDREDGDYFIGRTQFDSPDVDPEVLIPMSLYPELEIGKFYDLEITDTVGYDLIGKPV